MLSRAMEYSSRVATSMLASTHTRMLVSAKATTIFENTGRQLAAMMSAIGEALC